MNDLLRFHEILSSDIFTDAPEYADRVAELKELARRLTFATFNPPETLRDGPLEGFILPHLQNAVGLNVRLWDEERLIEKAIGDADFERRYDFIGNLATGLEAAEEAFEAVTEETVRELLGEMGALKAKRRS